MKWGEKPLRGTAGDWAEGRDNHRAPRSWGQGLRWQELLTRNWQGPPGPRGDPCAVQSRVEIGVLRHLTAIPEAPPL